MFVQYMVDNDYFCQTLLRNYEFWLESSALVQRLMGDRNKKKEERMEELKVLSWLVLVLTYQRVDKRHQERNH